MDFRSRAVRNLVELHEVELRRFLDAWDRFVASGLPVPDGGGDPDYRDHDHLCAHILMAARGYLSWIGEKAGGQAVGIDPSSDPREIAPRLGELAESLLAAYRRHLAALADDDLEPLHPTRWDCEMTIEAMLEHAVVHPMRHRLQLERILKGL